MDKETIIARLASLRGWMTENDVDAFVVRNVSNIAWLTGFEGVYDDEWAHTMLITQDEAVIHTDSRYATAIRKGAFALGKVFSVHTTPMTAQRFVELELLRKNSNVKIPTVTSAMPEAVASPAEEAAPAPGIFAIEDDITLAEFRAFEAIEQARAIPPKETSNVVRRLRAVKNAQELAIMQAAQDITDAAFAHMREYVKPGMTEREVQIELDDFMLWSGANGLAFSSIVAFGPNSAKPHAVPGDTKLEAGGVLLLDFGAKYRGYCSDMTRCLFLGEPTAPARHVFDVVREANEAVEAMLKPGVTGAEAQKTAEDVLEKNGFGGTMGHGLGHGVGIDIHEEPFLNLRNNEPLVAGNVVTVEPGIYLEEGRMTKVSLPMGGSVDVPMIPPMGVRMEDCGVITEDGYHVFTKSPHDIVII